MKVYEGKRVYGPYLRKDGRQIVILKTIGKPNCRTVSYPKYLVECALGRYLTKFETVDHIDGNFLNNEFSNLRIVSRSDHCKSHTPILQIMYHICPVCGNVYTQHYEARKTCGNRHCAGYYVHLPKAVRTAHEIEIHKKSYATLREELNVYPTVEELLHQKLNAAPKPPTKQE